MKNIYTQIVDKESQKNHPFGLAEKRFKWVEFYSNGNDLKGRKGIIRNKMRDNLEGGISKFVARNNFYNERNNYMLKKASKFINISSQRVIYPEKNHEKKRINKKRTFGSLDKSLRYQNKGIISSLIDRTPLEPVGGGRKMLINSVDYGRKKDTKLFSDAFLNDPKYNRIPGVDRKHLIKNVNRESEPSEMFSLGRKHYISNFTNEPLIY